MAREARCRHCGSAVGMVHDLGCPRGREESKVSDESGETLDLKACPFCGGKPSAEPWHGGGPSKTMVACESADCDVSPQVTAETPARVQALWNARKTPRTPLFRVRVAKD